MRPPSVSASPLHSYSTLTWKKALVLLAIFIAACATAALTPRQAPALPRADITFTSGEACGTAPNKFEPFTLTNVAANTCVRRDQFAYFTSAYSLATVPDGITCKLSLYTDPARGCSDIPANKGPEGDANTCVYGQAFGSIHASFRCEKSPPPGGYPLANVTFFNLPYCAAGTSRTDKDVKPNVCMKASQDGIKVLGSAKAETRKNVPEGYKCELVFWFTADCGVFRLTGRGQPGQCAPFDVRFVSVRSYKWVCGPV